jgi:hypothetical protein
MTGTVVTLQECLQSSGLILKELRASLLAGLRRPGIQGMPSPVNECYRLWLLKNSLSVENFRNLGIENVQATGENRL